MFVSYQQLTTMRSAVSNTILTSFRLTHYNLRQTLLQNAWTGFITKCFTLYYTKRTLLQNALLLQNAAEHGSLILWLSSVVNGRRRSNEPFSQFVVSNGKKFPFLYSFSSVKHSMVALSSIAFAMKCLSSSSSLGNMEHEKIAFVFLSNGFQ